MSRRLGIQSALVRVSAVVVVLSALAACSDRSMSITGTGVPSDPSSAMPAGLGIVEGTVDAAGNVTLTSLQSTQGASGLAPGVDANIYGTQNVNVRVYAGAATVSTTGGTKTWTMKFGVRNYLPYAIGSNQAGLSSSDTTGIFLAIVGGPTVSQTTGGCSAGCPITVTQYDGIGTFTSANQPYVYWHERLAAKQQVAGSDTVSQRRTIVFSSPAQVTNFRFYLLVGADWPAPAQTRWSVFYDGAADSAAGLSAKPRWKIGTQQGLSLGNEVWAKGAGADSLKVSGGDDYYLYRRDSLAANTPAYMETQVQVSGGRRAQSAPETVFGFLDGSTMAAVGMTDGKVGFVSFINIDFRFFHFEQMRFIDGSYSVDATKSHTYRLQKFGTDSVALVVDGTTRQTLTYDTLPGGNQMLTFTSGPAEFFGAGSYSGRGNSAWKYVTYGIGVSQP